MIFLIALAVAVIATMRYSAQTQSYVWGGIAGLLFGSVVYTLGAQMFPLEKHMETTKYELSPIHAADDDKDYYLLKQSDDSGVVNYAIQDNGQSKPRTDVNHVGKIVFDGKKEVILEEEKEYNFMLQPWQVTTKSVQWFHLPKDSLKEDASPNRPTYQSDAMGMSVAGHR